MDRLGPGAGPRFLVAHSDGALVSRSRFPLARRNRETRPRRRRIPAAMVLLPNDRALAAPALDAGAVAVRGCFLDPGQRKCAIGRSFYLVLDDNADCAAFVLPRKASPLHH